MPQGLHRNRGQALQAALAAFEGRHGILPGIALANRRLTLIDQMVSSLRRIEFIKSIQQRRISNDRLDPINELFDPIRGAILKERSGLRDEAVWLIFVATHFGKHKDDGWKLAANVLSSFGQGPTWTAEAYRRSPQLFENMLHRNVANLRDSTRSGRYSNHRQYQSKAPLNIARVFETFLNWLYAKESFRQLIRDIHQQHGQNPETTFAILYSTLDSVHGFGRLGKFDFLTMLDKLDLAPINAPSVYLVGATGPLAGAKLLFFNDRDYAISAKTLQSRVDNLDNYLRVGKQVIEDSMCNWQKKPDRYEYFRG